MKKPNVSQLKKKADKLFSIYIRQRDGELRTDEWWTRCFTCDTWKPLKQMQAGHFQTRISSSTRFHEQNVHAQCYSCNVMLHGNQYEYGLRLDERYGEGTAEQLYLLHKQTHKFTILELENLIERLQSLIK